MTAPKGASVRIVESISFNLRNLPNFRGRETRGRFWPYAALVIALTVVTGYLVMLPEFTASLARMRQFAMAHPDQATVETSGDGYSISIRGFHPELMPDIGAMLPGLGLVAVAAIVLLAAAVTRRLHDRGRRGWWGLLPLPFLAVGFLMMDRMFQQGTFDPAFFAALVINNLIYLGSLLLLIVQLAGERQPGDNRYGPDPAIPPVPIVPSPPGA